MIISEKQILKLMDLANTFAERIKMQSSSGLEASHSIKMFLHEIQEQQSEELKEVN